MWRYNPLIGNLDKVGLINVAPLCTITTSNWTGSTSGEILFTGDGATKDFLGKVDLPPVNPLNSFTLHYTIGGTTYDATADENGNITGTHITSGTINQDGTYEIHFDTAPDSGTDGTADYNHGIPPSNLENALDPSNPNPSDWGWTSTTGAGYYAYITFTLPEDGIYLFTGVIENEKSNPTSSLKPKMFVKHWAGINYRYETDLGSVYMDSSKIVVLSPAIVRKNFQIRHYITTACEFKVRFRDIQIFKLNNIAGG